MSNDEYLGATPREGQQTELSLARSTAAERRLDSECFAEQAKRSGGEQELLLRCKVQVVRWPPKDGRPAQTVTGGPAVEKAREFLLEGCFVSGLAWRSTVLNLNSCLWA